jgi:hypothetical protein
VPCLPFFFSGRFKTGQVRADGDGDVGDGGVGGLVDVEGALEYGHYLFIHMSAFFAFPFSLFILKSKHKFTLPKIPTQGSLLCPKVVYPYFPLFSIFFINPSFARRELYITLVVPSSPGMISKR